MQFVDAPTPRALDSDWGDKDIISLVGNVLSFHPTGQVMSCCPKFKQTLFVYQLYFSPHNLCGRKVKTYRLKKKEVIVVFGYSMLHLKDSKF
ncbi:hypothetical protein NPIL_243041 [Nephila pilipes]|uniref:Uncharacterized protein n=1 Tax=Nephila pilipes TaxID=299642 RepID=A0A8X6P7T7_NEPPI|nr:hypothetical protein NPIL_243041 [Nephila pilipes]